MRCGFPGTRTGSTPTSRPPTRPSLCAPEALDVGVRAWLATVGVRLFFVGGPERSMGLLRAAWQELLDASKAGRAGRWGRLCDRRCYPVSVALGVVPLVLAGFVEVPVRIEVAADS